MDEIIRKLIGKSIHSIDGDYLKIIHPGTSIFYFEQNFIIHAGNEYFNFQISYEEIGTDDLHYLKLKAIKNNSMYGRLSSGIIFSGNFKVDEISILKCKGLEYESTFDGMILHAQDGSIISVIPIGSVPEIEINFNKNRLNSIQDDYEILKSIR